ncbi:Asp-tRNA(Asn)/Glu-tRNA(Gln) amidotransferase subunit GatB [Clostridium sp. WILCCON 0269]|uniref:Aspartyl/glutamyl-tRNA(Asn/Gln) amidotransferase subunit B n=1 Tax=Candidatus Clostridium eludens TaxID=3381663 RepID=A0ABW8SEB0_9CLOT
MEFEAVIGLEVHAELSTKTKIYCGCSTEFGDQPNSHVCPICFGLPGALPRLNKKVVEYAIKAGLAFNCSINNKSRMDRKNYFYADCPKNYQITQHECPICKDGFIEIEDCLGERKEIGIERIHIEEDAGKLIHRDEGTLVDYNRAGVPLIEIVSKPDIRTSQEAILYLQKLRNILKFIGVSDCKMEQGSLRCDCNISVKPQHKSELGVRTEIKNMNSFKAIEKALEYEYKRQINVITSGEKVIQETRRWNDSKNITEVMRNKEYANDYRYFPEGDLVTINISDTWIDGIRKTILELPYQKIDRFIKEFKISKKDVEILVLNMGMGDFFENTAKLSGDAKSACNWLMGDVARLMNEEDLPLHKLKFAEKDLANLIKFINSGTISKNIAKKVIEQMFYEGKSPEKIIEEKEFIQNNSEAEILEIVKKVIQENPKSVEDYKKGKKRAVKFIIGIVMKKTGGNANPKIVNELVNEEINKY